MSNILTEAFKKLEALDEDVFEVDENGLKELNKFLDDDAVINTASVIDPNAESEDELKDSYVGKILCRCVVCQSDIMKDESEIKKDEACPDVVNCGEECPMCQSVDGYKIIGQIAEYKPADEIEDKTETEVEAEEPSELQEAKDVFKSETTIASVLNKPENKAKMDAAGADIAKLKAAVLEILDSDELKDNKAVADAKRYLSNTEGYRFLTTLGTYMTGQKVISNKKYNSAKDARIHEAEELRPLSIRAQKLIQKRLDGQADEFAEDEFESLNESFLKKVYDNVESYKNASKRVEGNKIFVEGVIKFKSGKSVKTQYVFEGAGQTKSGKIKFIGENLQFAKNKAFTITGRREGKKFVTESLNYKYATKDADGKARNLYGTIKK